MLFIKITLLYLIHLFNFSICQNLLNYSKNNSNLSSCVIYQKSQKNILLPLQYEDNENYFLVAIGIGEPIKYYPLQIDIKLDKTWIPSINCSNCKSLTKYNFSDSNSSRATNDSFSIYNNEGIVKGKIGYDKLLLNNIEITNFKFVECLNLIDNNNIHQDGKLGLGYYNSYNENISNFNLLEKLYQDGIIDRRVFALKEINDIDGELIIGDIFSEMRNKNFPLFNITRKNIVNNDKLINYNNDSWSLELNYILLDGNYSNKSDEFNIFKNPIKINKNATFDSTYSYIDIPIEFIDKVKKDLLDKYFGNIFNLSKDNNGNYYFSTNIVLYNNIDFKKLKNINFSFIFDHFSYGILLKDLFEQKNSDTVEFKIRFKKDNVINLGYLFIKQFIIVFDKDYEVIGIDGDYVDLFNAIEYYNSNKIILFIKKHWKIICGILGGLLLLILILLLYRIIRKNNNDSNEKLSLIKNENKDKELI